MQSRPVLVWIEPFNNASYSALLPLKWPLVHVPSVRHLGATNKTRRYSTLTPDTADYFMARYQTNQWMLWGDFDAHKMLMTTKLNGTPQVAFHTWKTWALQPGKTIVRKVAFDAVTSPRWASQTLWLPYTGRVARQLCNMLKVKASFLPRLPTPMDYNLVWSMRVAGAETWPHCFRTSAELAEDHVRRRAARRLLLGTRGDKSEAWPLRHSRELGAEGYVFTGGSAFRNFTTVVIAAQLVRVPLVIVAGNYSSDVAEARTLCVASRRCKILEEVNQTRYMQLIRGASLVILSLQRLAKDSDGRGITSLLEVRLQGKVPVLTPHPQWNDGLLATHMHDAVIAECDSPKCVATAMDLALSSQEKLQEMSINSLTLALGHYSPACMQKWFSQVHRTGACDNVTLGRTSMHKAFDRPDWRPCDDSSRAGRKDCQVAAWLLKFLHESHEPTVHSTR